MDFPRSLPTSILVTDLHGRMRAATDELIDLAIGRTNSWEGELMDTILPPASRILCQTHFWPLLYKSGHLREAYIKLKDHSGQDIPVLVNAQLGDYNGEPSCFWIFFVTLDRSRFEAELIEARSSAQRVAADLAKANEELKKVHATLKERSAMIEDRNRHLAVLSQTDPLTGLGNRRALDMAFEFWLQGVKEIENIEREHGHPVPSSTASLLMIDADHFKHVNDKWGHDEGDRILIQLADQLRASVRRSDKIVRYGGEEFAVWLPDANSEISLRIAEAIHDNARQIIVGDNSAPFTVSIGAATVQCLGAPFDLGQLLKLADTAVYQAKVAGRNRTVCSGLICTDTSLGGKSTTKGMFKDKATQGIRH